MATNMERLSKIQSEQDWDDENIGDLAVAFIFDPDHLGKGEEFVEFVEKFAADEED